MVRQSTYRIRLVLVLFAIIVCSVPKGLSQSEAKKPDSRPMVRLNVLASDRQDRLVKNLLKDDLVITDEGERQSIAYFALEELPVSYGLLIDTSGSLRRVSPTESEIAQAIINSNRPDDKAFVIRFAGMKNIQIMQDWTDDKTLLKKASDGFDGKGPTAITDALFLAADHIEKQRKLDHDARRRYAIILISDGLSNDGVISESKLLSRLRDLEIQIFTVCLLREPPNQSLAFEQTSSDDLVIDLAKETGGSVFFATKDNELQAICDHLIERMRSQFVIGYYPTKSLGAGKYHKVKARLIGKPYKEDNRISVRAGYNERAN